MKDTIITLSKNSYTVVDALQSGGQGSIWKVRRDDGVELALKSVLTHKMRNHHKEYLPENAIISNRQRIQSEIDFLKNLSDPEQVFIVPCLDSGFIKDDRYGDMPAWVMPFYPATLENKMPTLSDNMQAPSVDECLRWIKQVAIALKATHAYTDGKHVFVHRDIKASNMMLTEQGDIRLIDFGIVHETRIDEDTHTHSYSTESGAPEQFLAVQIDAGKNLYAIGPHSDMYGLGTVIYRLFTAMSTDAQELLKQEDTRTRHIKILDDNNTGLLGSIGGLSADEYKLLCKQIEFRLNEAQQGFIDDVDNNATIVSTGVNNDLPNAQFIAVAMADFVRDLLFADYKKRPDATQTLAWCEALQTALHPTLSKLSLSLEDEPLILNTPVKIRVTAEGTGLPANSDWIHLSRDGKPLYRALEGLTQDQHQFGFVTTHKSVWFAELHASQKADSYSVVAEAVVNGESISDKLKIQINDSSEALWRAGKHKQALCIDMRDSWLDELQHSCETLEQATEFSNLLKALSECRPDKKSTLNFRMQLLRDEFGRQQKFPFKFGKILTVLGLILILVGAGIGLYWYQSFPNDDIRGEAEKKTQQAELSKFESDLNSKLAGARSTAWRYLNRLAKKQNNLSSEAEEILAKFEKSSFEMAYSENQEQQKQAIPRLHLLANNGNQKAMLSLAKAYYKGQGTTKNWTKSWKWYQQANATSEVNQLEQQANKILQNLKSDPAQRDLAYQVAEQAAKNQAPGDPSQKWMEYRYRNGDGVPVDKEKAKKWKAIYDGKRHKD